LFFNSLKPNIVADFVLFFSVKDGSFFQLLAARCCEIIPRFLRVMQTDTGINRFSTFYKIVSISLAYTPQGLLAKVRDYKIRNVKQRRSI
jgi:hypothetical protein